MTSDNTATMKKNRAYKRLLCAVLENAPEEIINGLVFECVDCPETAQGLQDSMQKLRIHVVKDSMNYYIHYQGSRPVPVLKNSPLGRKLAKGAFKDE